MTPHRARRRTKGRGGQHGWEPRPRIEARTQRAVALAIQGWTQHEIAADLRVSQAAVSKMLARADARVLPELAEHVERHKVRQTQRLEHLYAELLRAWDRSKADSTRRRQRKSDPAGGGTGAGQTVAEVTVESRQGEAQYLEEARKVLADLRKVWGLDAPQRLDLRASRSPWDGLSDDELRQRLTQQDALLRRADAVIDHTPRTRGERA
jgi:predicted transcriptional regulator